MRILTFNYEYPPVGGGGGVVHELIAEELASRHHVVVITSSFRGLPSSERRNGVDIIRVPVVGRRDASVASLSSLLSYPPSAWLAAARVLRGERVDVIHSHFAVPTGPGSLLPSLLARVPHVLSIHGGDIFDPSKRTSPHRVPVLRDVVTAIMRQSAAVVAQSTNTRDNAHRFYDRSIPIEIIPLGIRQPSVPPASRAELELPEHAFLAVTVGRLVRRKGTDQLIRAMARPECARLHLAVVGAGPELAPLRALAHELGIADRVLFLGRVDETRKWQILRSANVYASATMHEGFGLVYLEAMAAGLPVVAPDHGGQVDFLMDGRTGYVVQAGKVEALAGALSRLADDPAMAKALGADNRACADEHRIEHCAMAYEALFERVLHSVASPGTRRERADVPLTSSAPFR